jgi:hypothetical protein
LNTTFGRTLRQQISTPGKVRPDRPSDLSRKAVNGSFRDQMVGPPTTGPDAKPNGGL